MRPHRRNIQAAIWLIGIGFLILTHHWWPGILILVGLSMVVGAVTRGAPQDNWPQRSNWPPAQPPMQQPNTPPAPPAVYTPAAPAAPAAQSPVYDLGWVPNRCASCGGPLNVTGLKVLDSRTVACPFCGTKISKGV